jgi:hypothetical protein
LTKFEDLGIELVINLDKEKCARFAESLEVASNKISEMDKATIDAAFFIWKSQRTFGLIPIAIPAMTPK